MTQEHKELLLKDLCARLPYRVKISVNDNIESLQGINVLDNVVEYGSFLSSDIEEVKPYLFPLSSMTEEQQKEYQYITERWMYDSSYSIADSIDWLNKNHFDYRGLIPMGLAIAVTKENNPYKE